MNRFGGAFLGYFIAPILALLPLSCAPRTVAPGAPAVLTAASVRWVKPSETAPHGQAPGARSRLIGTQPDGTRTYALVLSQGDEVWTALAAFASEQKVVSAHFAAIGGVRDPEIAWFDEGRKEFKAMTFHEQMEVVSLSGDMTLAPDGRPTVHTHVALARSDAQVLGGHLLGATVSPTLEVFVTVYPVALRKRPDAATGIQVIDPTIAD